MFITKRLKQWRLLRSELNASEQYEQFLELVKADLEDRKQLFFGRPPHPAGQAYFNCLRGERKEKNLL